MSGFPFGLGEVTTSLFVPTACPAQLADRKSRIKVCTANDRTGFLDRECRVKSAVWVEGTCRCQTKLVLAASWEESGGASSTFIRAPRGPAINVRLNYLLHQDSQSMNIWVGILPSSSLSFQACNPSLQGRYDQGQIGRSSGRDASESPINVAAERAGAHEARYCGFNPRLGARPPRVATLASQSRLQDRWTCLGVKVLGCRSGGDRDGWAGEMAGCWNGGPSVRLLRLEIRRIR